MDQFTQSLTLPPTPGVTPALHRDSSTFQDNLRKLERGSGVALVHVSYLPTFWFLLQSNLVYIYVVNVVHVQS